MVNGEYLEQHLEKPTFQEDFIQSLLVVGLFLSGPLVMISYEPIPLKFFQSKDNKHRKRESLASSYFYVPTSQQAFEIYVAARQMFFHISSDQWA